MDLFFSEAINLTPIQVIINLLLALALSFFLSIAYRITRSGFSYSETFNLSIIIMAIVVAAIIMVIGRNIALSLGLVGSLSIIRFRTAIKDSRDMMFLFVSILIGLSMGTNNYWIGFITTILCWIIFYLFDRWDFSFPNSIDYLLVFRTPADQDVTAEFEKIKADLPISMKLRSVHQISDDHLEYTYKIKLRRPDNIETLIKALNQAPNLTQIDIISPDSQLAI